MVKPDQGVQVVLDTAVTAKDFMEADTLTEQGFEEDDLKKLVDDRNSRK